MGLTPEPPLPYSYRDPNCSDSPLEYDNSLTLSLSTTTRITFLQVIFVYPDFAIFLMYFF